MFFYFQTVFIALWLGLSVCMHQLHHRNQLNHKRYIANRCYLVLAPVLCPSVDFYTTMSHATGTCLRELTSYQLSVQYYMYEIFIPRLI